LFVFFSWCILRSTVGFTDVESQSSGYTSMCCCDDRTWQKMSAVFVVWNIASSFGNGTGHVNKPG